MIQEADNECERLLRGCAAVGGDGALCEPILEHCRERSVYFIHRAGLNPYNFRLPCRADKEERYEILQAVDEYMNRPEVKREFGVDPTHRYAQCNAQVPEDVARSGDMTQEAEAQVTFLLDTVHCFVIPYRLPSCCALGPPYVCPLIDT